MPNLDASLATLRGRHEIEWYLAAFTGSVVLTGAVTADAADGATSLAYTTSTGDSADVQRGYLVRVTTAGGALKGVWRVRASGTISATALPITELSAGSIDINSGDLLEVRDVILPGAKVVEADALFRPDGLAVGTNNSAIPPMANAGPHWCGLVDAGQTYATVVFAGSLSYAVDGDSGGTVTYSWTAPTATGSTSSTSANPSFTFEAGEHLVTLTVTDSSNSATWTTYRKVRVYDASDTPWEVVVESIESDVEQGTSATFRIFEDGGLDDLPDGSLVCLFSREYVNGTEQSFGNLVASRSHMKALGYLRRDTNAANADDGTAELRFEIVSPMQFYREFVTGYSKVALHNTSADAWDELDDLSVKRMLIQIPRWYTWLTEFHDLVFHSSYDDRDYAAFYIQRSNPIDQMHELAAGVSARITCDRTGRVELQMLPYEIAEGSRSGITTWGTFTDDDRRDTSFEREHWRSIEMIEGRGFTAGTSGNQPIFSRWPGLAPGAGISSETVERLIADSQSDLNTRLGRLAAWRDGVYFTSTGVLHRAMNGETVYPGAYWFDPAYCEYLIQDFAADTNLRGIDPADHRFIITRVSSTPDNERGTVEHSVTWRTATNGPAGITYIPPQEADNGLPPWTPPGFDFGGFPVTPPGELVKGTGTIASMTTNNELVITTDLSTPEGAGGPTWALVALASLTNWAGTLVDWVEDAFSPGKAGGGGIVNGDVNAWVATTTRILRVTDIFNTDSGRAVAAQHTFRATRSLRNIQFERALQNWGICVTYYTDGVWSTYTTDGVTWAAETQITGHVETSDGPNIPGLWLDPHLAGHARTSAFVTTANLNPEADVYETFNYGASWSRITNPDALPGNRLVAVIDTPYPSSASLVYHARFIYVGGNPPYTFSARRVSGTTITEIGFSSGGANYGINQGWRCFRSYDGDANQIIMIGSDGNTTVKIGVWTSRNGGDNWTQVIAPSNANEGVYATAFIGGDGLATYLGGAGRFWYSGDFGATGLEDKTGNLTTLGVTGVLINITGGPPTA